MIWLNKASIQMFSADQPPATNTSIDSKDYSLGQKWKKYVTKSHPYILEIDNQTRKYVLAAKTHFDLEEWFFAIQAKIETLKRNDAIKKINENIVVKEKEIA